MNEATEKVTIVHHCTLCQQKYSRSQSLRNHYLNAHEVTIKNLNFPNGLKTIIPKQATILKLLHNLSILINLQRNCIAIVKESSSYNKQTCVYVYACPGCLFSLYLNELLSVHILENHTEVPNETNVFQGKGGFVGNQSSLSDQTESQSNRRRRQQRKFNGFI